MRAVKNQKTADLEKHFYSWLSKNWLLKKGSEISEPTRKAVTQKQADEKPKVKDNKILCRSVSSN